MTPDEARALPANAPLVWETRQLHSRLRPVRVLLLVAPPAMSGRLFCSTGDSSTLWIPLDDLRHPTPEELLTMEWHPPWRKGDYQ
jgi:hypothetical protein